MNSICSDCHHNNFSTYACAACIDNSNFTKKYSCLDCEYCFEAHVCNCCNEWDNLELFNISDVNKHHGQIGWVCTVFHHTDKERKFEVMKKATSFCEMFTPKNIANNNKGE